MPYNTSTSGGQENTPVTQCNPQQTEARKVYFRGGCKFNNSRDETKRRMFLTVVIDGETHEEEIPGGGLYQACLGALVKALQIASERGIRSLHLYCSDPWLVNAINYEFRWRKDDLIRLWQQVVELENNFESVRYIHVKRGDVRLDEFT